MKKLLSAVLAVLMTMVLCSCGTPATADTANESSKTNVASQQTDSASKTDSKGTAAESKTKTQTEIKTNSGSESTDKGNVTVKKADSVSEPITDKENDPDMVTGTLYAVFDEDDVKEIDFGYEEGNCTPERIAAALSEWTGLDFSISSQWDAANGAYTINWLSDSTLATGLGNKVQKDDFHFFDEEQLRWFMLNSLCRTIRENIGKVNVYYALEGADLDSLKLPNITFNPAIPYNLMEDPRVLG